MAPPPGTSELTARAAYLEIFDGKRLVRRQELQIDQEISASTQVVKWCTKELFGAGFSRRHRWHYRISLLENGQVVATQEFADVDSIKVEFVAAPLK